jgi:hypothetical protein
VEEEKTLTWLESLGILETGRLVKNQPLRIIQALHFTKVMKMSVYTKMMLISFADALNRVFEIFGDNAEYIWIDVDNE